LTDREHLDYWHERAAVYEYDGGMSRNQAESAAFRDWRKAVGFGIEAPEEMQASVREARSAPRPVKWYWADWDAIQHRDDGG
jgi:hypothetical protein